MIYKNTAIIFFLITVSSAERWYAATDLSDKNFKVEYPTEIPLLKLNSSRDIFSKPEKVLNYTHVNTSASKNKSINLKIEDYPLLNQWRARNIILRNITAKNLKQFRRKRKISYKRYKTEQSLDHVGAYSNRTKHSRFLEVFQVVEFDHIPCKSNHGLEGICLHEYDCKKTGGKNMGICADGYGTCCIVQFGCDMESAAPSGWFTNTEFPLPNTDRLSCAVTLHKSSQDVQQIRLDFLNFEILPPTAGNCEQDQFIVTGQNVNNIIPIICGVNTGQHVYIEVGNIKGPVMLSFQTVTADSRLFSIKVTQITMNSELSAPTGCLQYFKESQGHLESFNYRDRYEIAVGNTPSYLNNLNYAMCIERQPDACSITYTNVGNMQILNYDIDGLPVIPPRQAGVEIFNCPSDWLLISAVRLCGERLNDGSVLQDFSLDAPITDDGVGPIVVWFRSDSVYTGRGFKLHFQQNSCSVPS
ncbi:uncharacterized protein LOC119833864 [Zerene cesonia]|uniref:uncharacterized protein LOC119833864 n=1 Tax=Zerene cesonia TaxID=33412 RepID=UPI0018E56554|nr:uncharacterized protein LOC119833864 [Zerene cesonia]